MVGADKGKHRLVVVSEDGSRLFHLPQPLGGAIPGGAGASSGVRFLYHSW
jgi:hypothetical protein